MNYLTFSLALLNFLIASGRFIYCIRTKRIISIIWFLIAYFSFFFLPVAMLDSYPHLQGFSAHIMTIESKRIETTCHYIFFFNLIFLASEIIIGKMARLDYKSRDWSLPKRSKNLDKVSLVYFLFLFVGGSLYAITTKNFDYKDYVGVEGGNWSTVFLWASTPLITISALRKQFIRALIACIPFLYFAFHLKVRSFALLSIIPVAIIYALQISSTKKTNAIRYLRIAIFGGGLTTLLIMSSAVIMATKAGNDQQNFSLPDSGMPFGVGIMMELSDKNELHTGWDALNLYGRNLISPFIKLNIKLFNSKIDDIVDPPYVMGQYYDDVPKNFPLHLHYPALWYADAYFAFGNYGLWLAIFWAFVLIGWELIMSRSSLIFGLFLPFYSWHGYMLVRGAISGSSVPISYAFYISALTAFIILGRKLFFSSAYWSKIGTARMRRPMSIDGQNLQQSIP